MIESIPLLCTLTLCLCALPSGRAQAIPPRYTLTDLGTLGGKQSIAYGINAKGQVVGSADTTASLVLGFSPHAFLWENGTMTDLGTLDGLFGVATGINARGQVVADSST